MKVLCSAQEDEIVCLWLSQGKFMDFHRGYLKADGASENVAMILCCCFFRKFEGGGANGFEWGEVNLVCILSCALCTQAFFFFLGGGVGLSPH